MEQGLLRLILCFFLKGIFLFTVSPLYAQEEIKFPVQKFVVIGDNPLSEKDVDKFFAEYENTQQDISGLQAISEEFEKLLIKKGFNFSQVVLPPQQLKSGTISYRVSRITLSEIKVTGNRYFSDENILASLPTLELGEVPNTQKIASNMVLAQSNPAKRLRLSFSQGFLPDTVAATVTVQDKPVDDYYFWFNNSGTDLSTDYRLGVQANHRNLWGKDHQLALSYSFSPEDTDKVSQYGFNYSIPLYSHRGVFNFLYSDSDADTGIIAEVFDVSGAGTVVGLGYKHSLPKQPTFEHNLNFQLLDKLLDSNINFQGQNVGQDIRSRQIIFGYFNRYIKETLSLSSNMTFSKNLSGGSFNNDEAYAGSRVGASSRWQKVNFSGSLNYQFKKTYLGRFTFFGQYSNEPLISGEQFGLGGTLGSFGPRGFEEREVSLDRGYKFSLELLKNLTERKMQLGVFYDYGTGTRLQPQASETYGESLSSLGLIFRWNLGSGFRLDTQYGYILNGFQNPLSGSQDGDSKLHVVVQYLPKWSVFK